jgi:hypothetical protein
VPLPASTYGSRNESWSPAVTIFTPTELIRVCSDVPVDSHATETKSYTRKVARLKTLAQLEFITLFWI